MSNEKLDLILKELREVKQEQKEMRQEQQGMKQEQQGMKQELQDMKSQMNNRFDTLEASLALVNEKVNVMDQKLDGVHEQVAINAENIKLMQVDINQLKDIKERQEKTIDLLARRSIDQEAELRKIK